MVVVDETPAGRAAEKVTPSVPPELQVPQMKDVLRYATPFVPEEARKQFEEGLRNLYQL